MVFYYWPTLMPILISKHELFPLKNNLDGEFQIKFYHKFYPLPLRQDFHCFAIQQGLNSDKVFVTWVTWCTQSVSLLEYTHAPSSASTQTILGLVPSFITTSILRKAFLLWFKSRKKLYWNPILSEYEFPSLCFPELKSFFWF